MPAKIILLIDDDLDDTQLFRDAIEESKLDLVCLTAKNGEEGFHVLENSATLPDVILLDVNMPRMGGLEFLALIKNSASFKHIPVTMYSTSKSPEIELIARRLGAEYYIKKPNNFDEYTCIIIQVLNSLPIAIIKI